MWFVFLAYETSLNIPGFQYSVTPWQSSPEMLVSENWPIFWLQMVWLKWCLLKIAKFCNEEEAGQPAILPNSSIQKPRITPSLPDTFSFLNQSQDWLNTMKADNFILQSFYVCSGAGAFRTFISRHCGWETYSFKNKVRFSGSNLCEAAIVFRKKTFRLKVQSLWLLINPCLHRALCNKAPVWLKPQNSQILSYNMIKI